MDVHKAAEFRSNLLLLLHCGHPEGLQISQLKAEYKQYFGDDVGPEAILPRGFKNNKHWDALFGLKEFKDDFTLFYMGTVVFVKAVRKRNHAEMKLIAQLAKHSHLEAAKKAEFSCNCCTPNFYANLAKEAGVGGNSIGDVVENNHHHHQQQMQHQQIQQQHHPHSHHSTAIHPEDIVVKIEPHNMLNNGDDDSGTGDGINRIHEGLYHALDHQVNHGNHHQVQHHHGALNSISAGFMNGESGCVIPQNPDLSGSSASNMSNNTNDGFMLDHQLRVQQHSSPQGQSLQAVAAMLNNQANAGQTTNPDGSVVGQPFFTFLLQNGELKVMQVVSTVPETPTSNGEVHAPQPPQHQQQQQQQQHHAPAPTPVVTSSPTISATPTSSQSLSNIPYQLNLSDLINIGFACSTPGCKETFDDKQMLQNHERTCIHKKYPCTSPGCDRRFKNSKQRHAHMTSRHRGSENTFRCTVPECAAFFKTADRLKVHESRCRFKYEQFQLMDDEEEEMKLTNNNYNFNSNSTTTFASTSTTTTIGASPSTLTSTYHPKSTVTQLPITTSTAESTAISAAVIVESPHHLSSSGPHTTTAFTSSLQAASIMPEVHTVTVPGMTIPAGVHVKIENPEPTGANNVSGQGEGLQGFSTVDLSLVKSEVMEH